MLQGERRRQVNHREKAGELGKQSGHVVGFALMLCQDALPDSDLKFYVTLTKLFLDLSRSPRYLSPTLPLNRPAQHKDPSRGSCYHSATRQCLSGFHRG